MTIKPKEAILLTHLDILNATYYYDSRQTVLSLLKSKGAPILGNVLHEFDPKYDWNVAHNSSDESLYVTWTRHSNESNDYDHLIHPFID